jgi:hypothetical protein
LKVNLKSQIKPEVQVHSKPSECTKPAFTPKYEYVEVAKLIIHPDHFINNYNNNNDNNNNENNNNDNNNNENNNNNNNNVTMAPESSPHSHSGQFEQTNVAVSKYRSNIQNAIEFSQFGNKQNTSRIIITEPILDGELIIPIVVRRIVNDPRHSAMYVPQSVSHGFDGEPHYLTTYSKNNDPHSFDEMYETNVKNATILNPIKCKTTYDVLRNTFLNKIMTRFTGPNATRRAYQNIDFSGKGVISKNDLKTALIMMELLSITDNDFNLLYLELAGQPNKMIMYPGFKNYIEKHM